jgi:hypothetical protein
VNPDIIGEVYVIADNVKYENYKVLGNYYVLTSVSAHNIYVLCRLWMSSTNKNHPMEAFSLTPMALYLIPA